MTDDEVRDPAGARWTVGRDVRRTPSSRTSVSVSVYLRRVPLYLRRIPFVPTYACTPVYSYRTSPPVPPPRTTPPL